MMKTNSLFILFLLPVLCQGQSSSNSMSGEDVFKLVTKYYDPSGLWYNYRGEMHLYTLYPNGESKEEDLVIDNRNDLYQSTLYLGDTQVRRGIRQDTSFYHINGRQSLTEQERLAFDLHDKSTRKLYRQHLLHFNLPIYLKETGYMLDDQVHMEVFNGKDCLVLKFDGQTEENGPAHLRQAIHLFINPGTYSITGIRYPERAGSSPGAYVLFSEEINVGGIPVPKIKTYYNLADSSYWFTTAISHNVRGQYSNLEREKAAIKKVLDEETLYFYVRDFNKWTDCWSHKNDVYFSSTSKNGYSIKKGWEEVKQHIKNYMRENPDPHRPLIERSNFVYHMQGNLVWVYFDNREGEMYGRHQRVLRKENGEWKIINMTAINESSYEE